MKIIMSIKIYTKNRDNLNYNGKIEIIDNIDLLYPNDYCLFIFNDYNIIDDDIFELVDEYINTNADVISPIIINNNNLIYFGGIVLNNKTYFFSELDISYNKFFNNNRKYIKNTTLFYPEFFITNKSKFINNYNDAIDVLNHLNNIYKNNLIIKISQFVIVEQNTNTNYSYENIEYTNIKSFYFEKENIKNFLITEINCPLTTRHFCSWMG